MIRFSCPGCSATYTVGDEKGGKSGRCPKCQSQFTIPMPDASTSVPASTPSAPTLPPPPSAPTLPPPPPPPPAAGPVEIAPCPGCQAKLSVERTDLGSDVECPYCKTVFKAKLPGSGGSGTAGSGTTGGGSTRRPKPKDEDEDVLSGIPRGASLRGDEDDDDRPSRRSRTRDEDDEDERPSRRSRRRDEDDDDDDRPRRRSRSGSGGGSPVLGILALIAGILGIVLSCCCTLIGIPFDAAGIILGAIGMRQQEGKGMALAGMICGIVGLILAIVLIILNVALDFGGGGFQNNQRFR